MNNKLTVFVCGTFWDLSEERQKVLDAIRKLKHQHDSMEYFGARTERAIETCLEEVRQSDVLVVIVGHMYGNLVPDLNISYSEAEYNEGYRLGKSCLVYFRDENIPILPKFMENDADKMKLLTRFKSTLQAHHTTATFRDANDLAVSVTADLSRIAQNLESSWSHLAPEEILRHGTEEWNIWRTKNPTIRPNFKNLDFHEMNLRGANLSELDLNKANFSECDLRDANFRSANLGQADLSKANLVHADLSSTFLGNANFREAILGNTILSHIDLSHTLALDKVQHLFRSTIDTDTLNLSKGRIPEVFLSGCGLSDWEIESAKLFNPNLSNEEINKILYRMYDLRASQALQLTPLFISYSHSDRLFVDKLASHLEKKGIRYWRNVHGATAGRIEKQIDPVMRINPTVLLVLSEHSLASDWVQHEVRTARGLEKEMKRDVLCPIVLDDSWKSSPWPKRVMEQIMEYNILDFSAWRDDSKFDRMFRKLIDGLELFYKG